VYGLFREDEMVRGLKMLSLFLGYASLGFGGDYVVGLMAQDDTSRFHVVVREIEHAHEVDAHVQVRHSDRCAYGVERRVEVDASATELLRLRAGAGALAVSGREGIDRVEAVGMACASDEALLHDLTLSLERVDGDIVLSAHYPRSVGGRSRGEYARIDLAVEVPRGMPVDLDDSSGGLEVSGTGALRIDDSSGSIHVRDVLGTVLIDDSSGSIELRGISGNVSVDDGSGEIDLRDIEGAVTIRDGSGSVRVVGTGSDVVVERDGSGSIEVRDVSGDFSVLADGSGSIRHSGVAGAVQIPSNKRRRGN
jgi:hypothetical protein